MGQTREDRIAEYVDRQALAFRVKVGQTVACRVFGNYGINLTTANPRSRRVGSCTCPSDGNPCKHIEALRLTHAKRPRSFRDAEALPRKLGRRDKTNCWTWCAT